MVVTSCFLASIPSTTTTAAMNISVQDVSVRLQMVMLLSLLLQTLVVVAMVLVAMLLVPATDSAPAPAPVTVETLLLAKLLGLAGLKGE